MGYVNTQEMKCTMQDKTPRNEQGQRHGDWLWHNITSGNIMLKCYYLYDIPYGYLYYKPLLRYDGNIRIVHEYHAR